MIITKRGVALIGVGALAGFVIGAIGLVASTPNPNETSHPVAPPADPVAGAVDPADVPEPVPDDGEGVAVKSLYYGDSLLVEAARYLDGPSQAYEGTAICDWADGIERDVAEQQPDRVVLAFSGNAHTPCMRGVTWDEDVALAERYAADLDALRKAVAPVPVVWARTPVKHDGRNGIQLMPYDLDAGSAVERLGGGYTATIDGERVRHRDGVHFCPAPEQFHPPCPVDSPGARRFALALRAP